MNNWKRKLPFREIFTIAFVIVVVVGLEIEVVVANLEKGPNEVDQTYVGGSGGGG